MTISNQLLYHVARLLELAVFKSMKGTTASVTDIVAEVHDLSSAIANKPSELRVKLFEYMEGCRQLTYGARCLSLATGNAHVRGRTLAGAVVVRTFANKAIVCCPQVFLYMFIDMYMHMYMCTYL